MSVIGPRPQLVRDMVFMTPEQRRRHTAKPGLSGLAQVNGRNAISWEDKIEWDLKYIDGTEKSNRYFDASGNPVSLKKGKYGIQYVGDISLYLNRNGKIKWCVDNLLTGYPFMVVAAGVLLCILLCLLPWKLQKVILLAWKTA